MLLQLTKEYKNQMTEQPCGLGEGQPFMVLVRIWKISPKNINFFPSGPKKSLRVGSKSAQVEGGLPSYLLRVKSRLGSGKGPSLVGGQHLNV